jgi:hypothetical protein
MAAPQAPALLDVLVRTWKKFLETREAQENEEEDGDDEESGEEEV